HLFSSFLHSLLRRPRRSPLFPYTTLFRSEPGAPIWLRSGKTRILQFRGTVRRVSIGNPDLAGIVVLGPRTIMVNAKELPNKGGRSEEHTSELQSRVDLVCRLLLEKKNKNN